MSKKAQDENDSSRRSKRDRTSIRSIFGRWLGLAIAVALAVSAILNFSNVSNNEFANAESAMRAELDYLDYQIARNDAEGVGEVLQGYTGDQVGVVMLTSDGTIEASNNEQIVEGERLDAVLNKEAIAAIDNSLADSSVQSISFQLQSDADAEAAYLLAKNTNAGTVVIILTEAIVYADRAVAMSTATLSSALLLIVIYVTVRVLLRVVVARRIDETNEALSRITAGELDVRVEVCGSQEFKSLSSGINETVDALNGWIAEAKARMESELGAAKAIQESALPRDFPPFPDISQFDLYANMNPAREVGGDFYDFFLIGNSDEKAGKVAFVIADVSGKGVPAALFMMEAKAQIRGHLTAGLELGAAIARANDQLCVGNGEGMFVTAWVGVLDYTSGHVEFVNAGHNPPLVCKQGSWSWINERSGMPLGLFDGMPYEPHSLDCAHGDQFLLYTDGVTEAMSVDGELYGESRLESLLQESTQKNPHDLVDAVRASVAAHAEGAEQSDDITILALEIGPVGE